MSRINEFPAKRVDDMAKLFISTYERAYKTFSPTAFRKSEELPINMVIFELTLLLTHLLREKTDSQLVHALESLYLSGDKKDLDQVETPFEFNIKYGRDSKENISTRLGWVKVIVEALGDH